MKKTSSTPAVPGERPRSTAFIADSTPSTASTRGSRPPSLTSASTTTITTGSSARKTNGGPTWPPDGCAHQQRPDQHHQPAHGRRPPAPWSSATSSGTAPVHAVTSSTRSQPGPRILVTCGANAGDAASTSRVGPSETTSPSASTTTRSAACGCELHVVGRHHHRVPVVRESPEHVGELGLRRVVQTAGRLVEQQHRWRRRRAPRRARARAADPRRGRAGARRRVRRARAGRAACGTPPTHRPPRRTRRPRTRGRAGRPRSAAPARPARGAAPPARAAGSTPPTATVPARLRRGCPAGSREASTCRSRCGPSGP